MSNNREIGKMQTEATGARVMRSPVKSRDQIFTRAHAKRVNEDREEIRDADNAGGKEANNPADKEFWEMFVKLSKKLDALETQIVESRRGGNNQEASSVIDLATERGKKEIASSVVKISENAVLNCRVETGLKILSKISSTSEEQTDRIRLNS